MHGDCLAFGGFGAVADHGVFVLQACGCGNHDVSKKKVIEKPVQDRQ
jgi:hypothetical protein